MVDRLTITIDGKKIIPNLEAVPECIMIHGYVWQYKNNRVKVDVPKDEILTDDDIETIKEYVKNRL